MSATIEELRWKKFPVLSDGFVCLVDAMGYDSAIVQAARVSYGVGTKTISDDRTLIRYLMRNRHTSPFEMAELKFMVRVPMDTWRQWVRHRTASINEYSTRYSEAIDSMETTPRDKWRLQSTSNKQGSSGYLDPGGDEPEGKSDATGGFLTAAERELHAHATKVYRQRLDAGVAREQARKDLPLSTYTEAYWKIDLHNLLHFLSLRMDSHAQEEIRSYATVIGEEIVAKLYPMTWEAFKDYRLESMQLSATEVRAVSTLLTYAEEGTLSTNGPAVLRVYFPNKRERSEFVYKLRRFGLPISSE